MSEKITKSSQKAINSACRMLGIREHSEKQLRTKLIKKGFDKTDINEAVRFLYQESWLSSERFCESFIRSKVNKGQGKVRVEFELLQNGISQKIINQSFESESVDWQSLCEKVLEKKLTSLFSNGLFNFEDSITVDIEIKHKKELSINDKLRIERFMKYRGFDSSQVRSAFAKLI